MQRSELNTWFETQKPNMIRDLSRLVAIRSVREAAQPGMPFGPGPAAALAEGLRIAAELGFQTENHENYVGTALLNDGPIQVDILAHLDVVDEGTGWDTPPYQLTERDGMLYGRGTDDDKGPAIAVLYAMRAVRELGGALPRSARLILGTDEESGFSDIRHFFASHSHAPYTFSPDGSFPVVNVEKGAYKPVVQMQWQKAPAGKRLLRLTGSGKVNVVPAKATAEVAGFAQRELEEFCGAAQKRTGAAFAISPAAEYQDGVFQITAQGQSAHASTPEEGNNALTALLDLLSSLPFDSHESINALHAFSACFPHGQHHGEGFGLNLQDERSGALTVALTICNWTETGVSAQFDSRTPLCATEENLVAPIQAKLESFGFTVTGAANPPHATDPDTPFIRTLLECYEQFTGRKGECLSMGGGTYVHGIPGGVAFGAGMPGFESNLHSANERICIEDFLTAAKIFAAAIWKLCGGEGIS